MWLSMHAAVTSAGYEARLLTQMVRLPIPSWQEVEACRTYASEFERGETKQMFRVPWMMGPQEKLVNAAPLSSISEDENRASSTSPRPNWERQGSDGSSSAAEAPPRCQ